MNRIQQLHALGQSLWFDFIERSMIHSGELRQLVADGLGGVTSNPTIFQQAIAKSNAYQADLARLATRRPTTRRSSRPWPSPTFRLRLTCCARSMMRPTATTAL